ncbi:MAG: guanylate kinase [Candidatus Magasanikbacteria bacterium RIFOXYC2_FULL_42_28]|uniref:Guanylate kinase n=1 Tax=Candidatus Magasanikbacteria bacterium RIFOXYC2_FULL_42_28 TaxID=1798704 RepID=A0A1F6NWS4_9BACT|nr:MAG: guanylate kinase [Candidatus Magasanikbacteria bacterium RIFOXYC2_FULL_42_28]
MTGKLVIISSPSGGGKDAIIARLLKIFPNSARLLTTTTRPPRPQDTPGVSYDFVSEEQFKNGIANDEYLEHNYFNGNYYGVNRKRLADALAKNSVVFTNIDVNGRQSAEQAGIKHTSIFLLPDNLENLRARIAKRGGLNERQINERLETAKREIKEADKYNYQIINAEGKMEETVTKVVEILDKNGHLR